jgi:hypothetical protein
VIDDLTGGGVHDVYPSFAHGLAPSQAVGWTTCARG